MPPAPISRSILYLSLRIVPTMRRGVAGGCAAMALVGLLAEAAIAKLKPQPPQNFILAWRILPQRGQGPSGIEVLAIAPEDVLTGPDTIDGGDALSGMGKVLAVITSST